MRHGSARRTSSARASSRSRSARTRSAPASRATPPSSFPCCASRRPARDREPPRADARRGAREDRARATATIGATVDTGWWATQGYDPARAIEELGEHVVHVHLKDVRARRRAARDVPLGRGHRRRGGVRARAAADRATRALYASSTSRRITIRARSVGRCGRARAVAAMRIALVGCGNIADALRGARSPPYRRLELAGATDVVPGRADALVAEHGGRAYADLDALLADDRVDTVVNLTAPQAHAEVTAAASRRASTSTARSRSRSPTPRRRSSSSSPRAARRPAQRAPATLLGEAQQTAWKLVREGAIGTRARRLRRGELGPDRDAGTRDPRASTRSGPLVDVGIYPLTIADRDLRAGPAGDAPTARRRARPTCSARASVPARGAGLRRRGRRARVRASSSG